MSAASGFVGWVHGLPSVRAPPNGLVTPGQVLVPPGRPRVGEPLTRRHSGRTTAVASRSSSVSTYAARPAAAQAATVSAACDRPVSITSWPPGRSQPRRAAATRRCRSTPVVAAVERDPRLVVARLGRHRRDRVGRDVRRVDDQHVDPPAQAGPAGRRRGRPRRPGRPAGSAARTPPRPGRRRRPTPRPPAPAPPPPPRSPPTRSTGRRPGCDSPPPDASPIPGWRIRRRTIATASRTSSSGTAPRDEDAGARRRRAGPRRRPSRAGAPGARRRPGGRPARRGPAPEARRRQQRRLLLGEDAAGRAQPGGEGAAGSDSGGGLLPRAVGRDVGPRGAAVGAVAARLVGRGVDVDVGRTWRAAHTPIRVGPRSQTSVASPSSASPISSWETESALVATCRWRSSGSWSEIIGVIGCFSISSLSPAITPCDVGHVGGLEDRPQLALEASQHGRVAVGARRVQPPASGDVVDECVAVGQRRVEQPRRRLGVPHEVHGASLRSRGRAGGRTDVIRWTANRRRSSLRTSYAASWPPSTARRVHQPLGPGAVVVDVADQDRLAGVDRLAERGQRPARRQRLDRARRGGTPPPGHPPGSPLPPARPGPPRAPRRRRGRRPRGVRARSWSGRATWTRAVGGLDHRRGAQVAQPRQQHLERQLAGHDRGRQPAQPQRRRLRVVEQPGEHRLVVGPQVGLGVAGADAAEGAGGVVDEVAQRLRHLGRGDLVEERVDLVRRPALVEGAAQRAGGEPVDGRAPARLDVGQEVQPPAHRRLERAGGDGGEVGLQHDLRDRRGQQRRQRGDGRVLVAGEQRRDRGRPGRRAR